MNAADDQYLPPPIMVQAYLVDDEGEHQNARCHLPTIMAQAQPVEPSNQCTFRTVSLEYALVDGTVMVHTEKLLVFPDGSVRVVESRDHIQQPLPAGTPMQQQRQPSVANKPTMNTTTYDDDALPIRVQTSAVPSWSHRPRQAGLPTRVQTDAVPRGHGIATTNNAANQGHAHTFAVTSNGQPSESVHMQTAAMPHWGYDDPSMTPMNSSTANYYGHLPTRLPGYIVSSSSSSSQFLVGTVPARSPTTTLVPPQPYDIHPYSSSSTGTTSRPTNYFRFPGLTRFRPITTKK